MCVCVCLRVARKRCLLVAEVVQRFKILTISLNEDHTHKVIAIILHISVFKNHQNLHSTCKKNTLFNCISRTLVYTYICNSSHLHTHLYMYVLVCFRTSLITYTYIHIFIII